MQRNSVLANVREQVEGRFHSILARICANSPNNSVQAPAPFFPQKGTRAMSDNQQARVTVNALTPVTTQLSANQPSLREAVLQDLLFVYAARLEITEHVLAYLASVEDAELDPWVRTDIRIAWLTVLYAAREYQEPHVYASYMTLGLHPDKVWPSIQARRDAMLGQPSPASPKKRPRKVTPLVQKAAAGGD